MKDIARRFPENPLLSPSHLQPSAEGLHIACLLNPGVFQFQGKTWMLVRVAERPQQDEVVVSFPILTETGETEIMKIALNDADLIATDARVVRYKGIDYLTTLSHLRLLCSNDGVKFYEPEGYKKLFGKGALQTFGIEDCRVTQMGETYYLTFTAVSASGVGVGMKTTTDWKTFQDHGMILPPHNKDCAIFEEKINGLYYMLHRPSSVDLGGNYIWLAESPDGEHWGNHKCIIKTRADNWDNARVGAGCAPIKTDKGWLEIYHGASFEHRYCLGAFLLDLNEPWKVLARTNEPIMVPTADYELTGFFGHVVFTNGHIINGDELTIYYGAADEHVCGAKFSIKEIMDKLEAL
jgi:predicted GH43/DUF377 family glycosyl hydrolase